MASCKRDSYTSKQQQACRVCGSAGWWTVFILTALLLLQIWNTGCRFRDVKLLSAHAPKGGLPFVSHRDDIAAVLERLNLKVGAELGVQTGTFSKHNLERWKSCEKYYLVDLWRQQVNYKDGANVNDTVQEALYQRTQQLLQPWGNITVFLRMLTVEAAQLIPDDSLDFVYVDARHDYCGAMEDLQTYWPKLKRGGVFAGHDFVNAAAVASANRDWGLCMNGTRHPGAVKGAVDDFAFEKGLVLSSTTRDWPSWLTRKV